MQLTTHKDNTTDQHNTPMLGQDQRFRQCLLQVESPEGGGARAFKESGEPACRVHPIKAHHLQSAKLHTETRGHQQRVRYMAWTGTGQPAVTIR